MGCWNGTCMVSNLPILVGDPVVCQFIVTAPFWKPSENASDCCYATDRFQPVGWPFRAEYDDYGYIQAIQEDAYTFDTLDFIQRHLIELPLGENKYHDHEVRRDQVNFVNIGRWLHGKRMLLNNPAAFAAHMKERPMGMVMIHQGVYGTMASHRSGWGWRDLEVEIRADLMAPVDDLDFLARDKMKRHLGQREMNNPRDLQGSSPDETVRRLIEAISFSSALDNTRRQWMPISGAGSQSEEWDLFEKIAKTSKIIANKRIREIAELEDDD